MANKLGNDKTWVLILGLCLLLSFIHITKEAEDTVTNVKELDDVDKLLPKLNKPAVKSLKSPDGDTIDCVHILHQPAFDHPKLKDHKIQMRPTFLPKGRSTFSEAKTVSQLWHQSGSCPEGTVPIRRTTKDDVMRASSFQRFAMKDIKSFPKNLSETLYYSGSNHEYATAVVKNGNYYGARAFINVWKPNVQQRNEYSLSQIWVMNEEDSDNVETIEAGWQIHPMLYGDDWPRVFGYWTSDSYEHTGCYNLQCSGFVQVSGVVVMGGALQPISIDGGPQYGINVLILKDPGSGNWWLKYGNINVGYWPASLFDYLSESASIIQWGGEVMNKKTNGWHTTTAMGSGYFPRAGFGKASIFMDISIVIGNNYLASPRYFNAFVSKPKCYDIVLNYYSENWGSSFFYGGPGRNFFCPI